jgi:hypothetical protein
MPIWILLICLLLIIILLIQNSVNNTEPFTPGFRTFYRPRIRNMRYYVNKLHNDYYINMVHYFRKKRVW